MSPIIRVASYCRVSTDQEDQANSFEAQQRYFRAYIDRQPDWTLYEVYADEGITGTSTKKRTQFNRMIGDARKGRFGLIITKEVSRFSRNILDTIAYTRELKALGVGVLFMNDGISTLEPDAELRLSIMASIAQEESRKTSERVKWGQTRQMERGVVFGRSLLGYEVKEGRLTVEPEGAEIVRMIFRKYGLEQKGTSTIARELREAGYRTYTGNSKWSGSHIVKILKNEKYVGDLVQKKTYTPDYLTHARKHNHGEEELVILRDHHEPIIDRPLWELVQAELKKRSVHAAAGEGHSNRYVCSGKIKCGECGASFVARKRRRKDGTFYRRWNCFTAVSEGRRHRDAQGNELGCDVGKTLRDEMAMELLRRALCSLRMDTGWIIAQVTDLAMEAMREEEDGGGSVASELEQEIVRIKKKKEGMLDAFFSGQITTEELGLMRERYDGQLAGLRRRLDAGRAQAWVRGGSTKVRDEVEGQVAALLAGQTGSDVFWRSMLERMVVFQDKRVEVYLQHLPQTWVFSLGGEH